jgi:hypothetical protein
VYLQDHRTGNWRKTDSYIGNHKAVNYQDDVQDVVTIKLWDAIWFWKSTFWCHTWIFSPENLGEVINENSESFTKTLWLLKSVTKASEPQVCWQTIVGQWRGMYLTQNTSRSDMPLHFRGQFLPVSWACKVLFCTFKFLLIFQTSPDRKILYSTYLNST